MNGSKFHMWASKVTAPKSYEVEAGEVGHTVKEATTPEDNAADHHGVESLGYHDDLDVEVGPEVGWPTPNDREGRAAGHHHLVAMLSEGLLLHRLIL
jgi:hypothetical protein